MQQCTPAYVHYFVTFNFAKRDNFGPQYPEKYWPHLFHFLKNDYLDDTALILLKEYEIRIFHFLDTLIIYSQFLYCVSDVLKVGNCSDFEFSTVTEARNAPTVSLCSL